MELEKDLNTRNIHGRTLTVKIKDEDFSSHTRSRTFNHYISDGEEIFALASILFGEMEWDKSLRLLGVSVSNLMDRTMEQLSFLGEEKIQQY